ncbi:MAG: 4Fe-4S dicluster domain-containing protein [Puniceicoccales bacterium]|jgi:NADH-quinone oxidoreductase subunit I|nr:4Fe-4S dicluster domain-containing protein [Puniceicoccales bacterium]
MLGTGILKGLFITAKNLVGSYYDKERLTTLQYPEEAANIPENYRNFPFLVFDGEDAVSTLRCVACKMCEKECPPQCIYIVSEKDEKGKIMRRPKVFDIDISVCMGCGICAEVCPSSAIKMDHIFEVTAKDRFSDLLLHRDQLAKSVDYYKQIHPTDFAVEEKARAEKKRVAEEKAQAAAAATAAKAAAAAKTATAATPKTDVAKAATATAAV